MKRKRLGSGADYQKKRVERLKGEAPDHIFFNEEGMITCDYDGECRSLERTTIVSWLRPIESTTPPFSRYR